MNQNHVSLIGRLTDTPRIVEATVGTICNLSVAVNGLPKKGTRERSVEFVPVTVFGNQAATCGANLVKGQEVRVDGRLHFRKEQVGDKNVTVGVVWAKYVEFGMKPRSTAPPAE
ncbi:MAG: hypothetical protein OJF50_006637 [Nitrospira sp.]|jgi:single-strand DNA-binding protein|nr:hypothetical protein [Nitrospira sp.]